MTSDASDSQSCNDSDRNGRPQEHSLDHSHSENDDETNTQITDSDLDAFRHSTNSPSPEQNGQYNDHDNDDYYSMNQTNNDTASLYSHSTLPTHAQPHYNDCTSTVHHMHNLLLYLLTNPMEFTDAIAYYHAKSTTSTLTAFHAEYDRGTDVGSMFHTTADEENVPIPFLVFCSDAEVVLPQAHTASQLFGYEREGGIELEAASGILGLCQLFLRWLALMPGGDHMNLISPPGLTVMRIAGGRYRVTAAHRVVWTWNNEFLPDPTAQTKYADELHVGDLVTMTIVDVFETDADGKLLSYCPTFDNRAIYKTTQKVEQIRKSSSKLVENVNKVKQSKTAERVNQAASLLGKLGMKAAGTVKDAVEKKMEDKRRQQYQQSQQSHAKQPAGNTSPNDVKDVQAFERALNHAVVVEDKERGEHYISDDETTSYGDR